MPNDKDDEFSRRSFLDRMGAAAVLGATGVTKKHSADAKAQSKGAPGPAWTPPAVLTNPNILVIMVDQLRLPAWLTNLTAGQSLATLLPNITSIQNNAYNFGQYFVAATMCTPSRSTLLTGLYAPQTGVYVNGDVPMSPALNTAFPTWGQAIPALNPAYHGNMWWFGKWHLSQQLSGSPLAAYGFTTRLYPGGPAPHSYSPDGVPNEGTDGGTYSNGQIWASDSMIAGDFVGWIQGQSPTPGQPAGPWCATVSLVNPHDITDAPAWLAAGPFPPSGVPNVVPSFPPPATAANPPKFYAGQPNNWNYEALTASSPKPGLQYAYLSGRNYQLGTVQDWVLFLNQYMWLQGQVDLQIGRVLAALKSSPFASNTVVIFTADHGEFAGSHGMHGKGFAVYDEAIRVPMSVQFPGQTGAVAMNQMCSSVDFFGLVCDLATGGSGQWRLAYPDLANRQSMWSFIYGNSSETRVAPAPVSAPYILHTFDDSTLAKPHITCIRTASAKLAFYSQWTACTVVPNATPPDWEFYDYSSNASEMGNDYTSANPSTQAKLSAHLQVLGTWGSPSSGLIGSELNAPLVGKGLTQAQSTAQTQYFTYYSYITGGGTCG